VRADAWSTTLSQSLDGRPASVERDSLCVRAAAALDTAFALSVPQDSVYAFITGARLFAAFQPLRPGVLVTLVEFDPLFVERGRRSVLVP
jgi:hypothetical protein